MDCALHDYSSIATMSPRRPRRTSSLARQTIVALTVAATFICAADSSAQTPADSIGWERRIAAASPESPFTESARRLLLERLSVNDGPAARGLTTFMDRRSGAGAWLTPTERLRSIALQADREAIQDHERLGTLLATAPFGEEAHGVYPDNLATRQLQILRDRRDQIMLRFDETNPSQIERQFFNLLLNHLTIRGYRTRVQLNARVDQFVAEHPESPYAVIADRSIRQEYRESEFGASFSAGYAIGGLTGNLGDHFEKFHGPALAGELYFDWLTIAGDLQIGVASAPAPFTAAGVAWEAGKSSFISMSLSAGYEFRFGLLAVTPLAGLAVQSVRAPETTEDDPDLPRTRNRLGWDAAAIVGYRIPFDVGPHLDLRARVGVSSTTLSEYDSRFSGMLYYAQLGFALVQRPYRGR